jgi:hypothetical protein
MNSIVSAPHGGFARLLSFVHRLALTMRMPLKPLEEFEALFRRIGSFGRWW